MALVIRGKLKGQTVELHQWCNDWFSVNTSQGPKILSPTQLAFTDPERLIIETSFLATTSGTMSRVFMWNPHGGNRLIRRSTVARMRA